jgi:predicted GNAT family N-acyltransferase
MKRRWGGAAALRCLRQFQDFPPNAAAEPTLAQLSLLVCAAMVITSGLIQGEEDLAVAHSIRLEVFVTEQAVPASIEMDGLDDQCQHFMAWQDSSAVATARLRVTPYGYKLERVAVLAAARRQGVGTSLVRCAVGSVPAGAPLYVHAQDEAIGFWQHMGFVAEGAGFDEGGIAHRRMIYAPART